MRSSIVNLDRNDTSPNAAGTKKKILVVSTESLKHANRGLRPVTSMVRHSVRVN